MGNIEKWVLVVALSAGPALLAWWGYSYGNHFLFYLCGLAALAPLAAALTTSCSIRRKEFIAIGIFQGDADWNISVRVGGFLSRDAAKRYANSFRIRLIDGHLYRDHGDGVSPDDKPWFEVSDRDVSLSRIKPEARSRIAQAHRKYREQRLNAALESIREFEKTGKNDLVLSEADYEAVGLPIARWHQEVGLTCGFTSLAYRVDETADLNKANPPRDPIREQFQQD